MALESGPQLRHPDDHGLLQQMAAYFLGHEDGRYRSSRIVPEPFFVHSDLTTGVFLADLTAYILGWGWRLRKMRRIGSRALSSMLGTSDLVNQMYKSRFTIRQVEMD